MFSNCVLLGLTLCVSSGVAFNDTTCSIWQYTDNATGHCRCGFELFCRSQDTVEIEEGYCTTSAANKDYYYIGMCLFMHRANRTNRLFSEMPDDPDMLDDVMCGHYNRKGLLCGECYDGFGPAVYSIDLRCANCSGSSLALGVFLYTFIELVPLTVFFMCMLFFRLSITSGPMLGYLLFCQGFTYLMDNTTITTYISTNVSPFLLSLFHMCTILCRFWTMHWIFKSVIPPFCISEKLTGIHLKMLAFVSVSYPMFLVFITFILFELHAKNYRPVHTIWKPFRLILKKVNIKTVTSDAVIHTFASFIFLSHLSVLNTFLTLCTKISTYKHDGGLYRNTVFGDPTVEWFSNEHKIFLVIAVVPLTFLTILPSTLLTLYTTRTYRYISSFLSARKRLAITAFVEALHSVFKDGLNGTRDYRALAGLTPVFIIVYGVFMEALLFAGYVQDQDIITAVIVMFAAIVVSYARPCKSTIANASLSFHCFLFGVMALGSHLWNSELNVVGTKVLELLFILVLLTSHLFVCLWVGYRVVLSVKVPFGRTLTLLKEKAALLFKNQSRYQELT